MEISQTPMSRMQSPVTIRLQGHPQQGETNGRSLMGAIQEVTISMAIDLKHEALLAVDINPTSGVFYVEP